MREPGNHCSICASDMRAGIEADLFAGLPLRDIAGRFNVSRSALSRHSRKCISASMAAAGAIADEVTAERLVAELRQVRTVVMHVLDEARADGDHNVALAAIARLEKHAELVGRLAGELVERHRIDAVSVVVDQQWLDLRARLICVLEQYPEALSAVTAALAELE